METSFKGQLSGSEIHGFHTVEDLEMEKIIEEATTRWLRPNEIHAILYNYTYFTVRVKPVNLPQSGAILLFDRKMLRHFRKDGHNWKKKNDGKTVKEAHEHLKVGNEERIHVYYAHGQDNPNFVRRCYWLLDKKKEHIVLVHYRETLESQGSPMTPVNSSSSSGNSDQYRVLSEETDTGANHAFSAGSSPSLLGKSTELGDSMTVINHEMRLHEINTLEWEDLLATQNSNDSTAPTLAEVPYSEEQYQYALTNSKNNGSLFPTGYLPEAAASFSHPTESIVKNSSINVKPTTSEYLQMVSGQMNTNVHNKEFQLDMGGTDGLLDVSVTDGLQTQDSFGRWMNYIMTDSPGSVDDPSLGSPISNEDASSVSKVLVQHQSHFQEQVFSITDISPSWAFSTEETKVIVIGSFQGEHSNLLCVFGDICVPAEMIQVGVYRCMAFPHAPGVVNFYLSLDGHTPISQVLNFEYRSSSMDDRVPSPENKSQGEEFPIQMRLAHLLFSTTNSLSILSSKISANALREAKRFALTASSIVKEWSNLIKSVGDKKTPFPQAKESLFELTLKSKLQEWLLERVVEGCKTTPRDHQGQGVIHLCAILGYTWAVYPYSRSGLSLDFRDASGWTALHWAAYCGREKMVAVLLSAGAKASLVSDPTSECPGGYTAADLASKNGHDGLGAYLAEKGLIAHFNDMYISGNISGSLQTTTTNLPPTSSVSEEEMYLNDSLTAYRTAADAASRIQAAFRENSFKQRSKAVRSTNPETEARTIIAAMKIQHAFRNYDSRKKMAAAAQIQYRFRSWKIRKDFLNMRRQAIKIQAVFRGFQVRRQYRKIIWSVGVLEKAILRWRLKRKGFRGLQVELPEVISTDDKEEEGGVEDFFRASRKQAEDRVERSVVRVQAMFRSKLAQQEYHRMKVAFDQAKLEFEEEFDPERLMKG